MLKRRIGKNAESQLTITLRSKAHCRRFLVAGFIVGFCLGCDLGGLVRDWGADGQWGGDQPNRSLGVRWEEAALGQQTFPQESSASCC